eukprot:gene3351-biopygen2109
MPPLLAGMLTTDVYVFTVDCLMNRNESLATAKRKFVLLSFNDDFPPSRSFLRRTHRVVDPDYLLNHPLLVHWYSQHSDINHPKHTGLPWFLSTNLPEDFAFLATPSESTSSSAREQRENFFASFLRNLDLNKVFPHINQPLQYGRSTTIYLEQALELFTDDGGTAPADWIPLADLPQRVTTIFVVLVPIPSGPRSASPSLTSEVLVFRDGALAGLGPGAKHVAFLPFTAALYHRLQQHPYGDPNRLPEVVVGFGVHASREKVQEYFETHPSLAALSPSKSLDVYYNFSQHYNFVMSPPGYGYDCFRTYEALALGLILFWFILPALW